MDDLPELPFEKVLSYLSLEDRLKARAVSRRWYHKINSFRPKTLCYSAYSRDLIWGKNRWVSGAFAKNFISSTRFATFFGTFGQTILSSLKHLRFCEIDLSKVDPTTFTRTLNSFGQLEQLDIIRTKLNQQDVLRLNLPILTSIQLEYVDGIKKLTLKAPTLREVKILDPYGWGLSVEIVHGESVERLLVDRFECMDVSKVKNLQYLYVKRLSGIDSTFLSSLQQLKEFHTNDPEDVSELFEQKQRSARADLKIYLWGLLLNGRHDPAINALRNYLPSYLTPEAFACLAENPSRLADAIPFYRFLYYSVIESVVLGLKVDLLKRFTNLNEIVVDSPVRDVERFLNFLKNCEYISELVFSRDQPALFDRLPEHSAVQKLTLYSPPSDLDFLFRLKHLIYLELLWSIDSETVRRALEELPALSSFYFRYDQKKASIAIDQSKQFQVSVDKQKTTVADLNAAIEFIVGNEKPSSPKKRKADDLK